MFFLLLLTRKYYDEDLHDDDDDVDDDYYIVYLYDTARRKLSRNKNCLQLLIEIYANCPQMLYKYVRLYLYIDVSKFVFFEWFSKKEDEVF